MPQPDPTPPGVRFHLIDEDPRYGVGCDGSAWSCAGKGVAAILGRTTAWRPLKPVPCGGSGGRKYLAITVRRFDRPLTIFVHVLVARYFIGPRPEGFLVCHRDDDPNNNRVENLYYGTDSQNWADSSRNGRQILRGEQLRHAVLTTAKVRKVVRLRAGGLGATAIAAKVGCHRSSVCSILRGLAWRHVTGILPGTSMKSG